MTTLEPQRTGQQEEEEDGGLDHEAEKKMESLIMSLEVFCFKRNLTAKEFFDSIYEMYIVAQRNFLIMFKDQGQR
jgi:hypothetical protein